MPYAVLLVIPFAKLAAYGAFFKLLGVRRRAFRAALGRMLLGLASLALMAAIYALILGFGTRPGPRLTVAILWSVRALAWFVAFKSLRRRLPGPRALRLSAGGLLANVVSDVMIWAAFFGFEFAPTFGRWTMPR